MSNPYSIRTELDGQLLNVELEGFWSEATTADFASAFKSAVAALPCRPGEHRIICDVSDWPIQSQSTANVFREWIHQASHAADTRMAVVGASTLLRLQVTRVAARPTLKMCDDAGEARQWLSST